MAIEKGKFGIAALCAQRGQTIQRDQTRHSLDLAYWPQPQLGGLALVRGIAAGVAAALFQRRKQIKLERRARMVGAA